MKNTLYMTRILVLSALVWVVGAVHVYAQPVQFFESLQDVPLMPGLVERSEDTVLFDKPGGRVVESVAEMADFSQAAVENYYSSALPQFGWKNVGTGQFTRQGEALELVFEKNTKNGREIGFLRVLVQPQ